MAAEVVVIGAGPNGLATAGLLARAGRRVLVLERRESIGGLAAAEEFHPGFRSPGLHHDSRGVRRRVVEALELVRHGLQLRESPAEFLVLDEQRSGLLLGGSPLRTAERIGRWSAHDAEAYSRYHEFLTRMRRTLGALLDEPPIDLVHLEAHGPRTLVTRALRLRLLGRADLTELMRLPSMAVADWLAEWFEDEPLRAALALPALAGTRVGPRAPGTAANLLLLEAAAGPGVVGGGPALVRALQRSALAAGAEIRTAARVQRILVGPSGVEGVMLASGETIPARAVAASCDPQTLFLDLVPGGTLSRQFEQRIREWRARGTTAQVLLALSRPPAFAGAPEGGVEFATTAGRLDDIERAADTLKYGAFPEHPALEVHVARHDAFEAAPPGHAVVSVLVHFAAYDLRPAWDEASRERLGDRVMALLERHAPGLSASVQGRLVLTPVDIEQRHGVRGGHVHHGEHALDQILVRPAPGCVGSRTPLPGLYLCGSGSHPGGGLTGAPGALAAAAMRGQVFTYTSRAARDA